MVITNGFNLISVLLSMHIVIMLQLFFPPPDQPWHKWHIVPVDPRTNSCLRRSYPLQSCWFSSIYGTFMVIQFLFCTSGINNIYFFLCVSVFYFFCKMIMNRTLHILYSIWQSTAEIFASTLYHSYCLIWVTGSAELRRINSHGNKKLKLCYIYIETVHYEPQA